LGQFRGGDFDIPALKRVDRAPPSLLLLLLLLLPPPLPLLPLPLPLLPLPLPLDLGRVLDANKLANGLRKRWQILGSGGCDGVREVE
jgi:hypothetical protein